MTCEPRYDLRITDGNSESHGLILDWPKGGAGFTFDTPTLPASTAVSTKGDYGVRDAKDAFRIVQTDWSVGQGQETYDHTTDSESGFWESKNIDTSVKGTLRLGREMITSLLGTRSPVICVGYLDDGTPALFAGRSGSPFIEYSLDGDEWSAVAGTVAEPVCLTSDGDKVYAARKDTGQIIAGNSTGWASLIAGGDNADFDHLAFASGVLYGSKMNSTTPEVWAYHVTANVPALEQSTAPSGSSINAVGENFGLVPSQNVVYWGVTNGTTTKVFKVMYGDGSVVQPVLQEVAVFPDGFVGLCMYSYLGDVYVGGCYPGVDPDTGIGAIYAIISDTPALLTEVGTDRTLDNRVVSISAWERDIYFVAASQVWRWDMRYGGYSHWTGPLDPSPVQTYADITWDKTWDFSAAPSAATIDYIRGSAISYANGEGAISVGTDDLSSLTVDALADTSPSTDGLDDTVGITAELDLLGNCLSRTGQPDTSAVLYFGIDGSAATGYVRLYTDPSDGSQYVHCDLYSGNKRDGTDDLIARSIGFHIGPNTTTYTIRLTIHNWHAKVYVTTGTNTTLLCEGSLTTAPTVAKSVWLKAGRKYVFGTHQPQWAYVDRVRWTSEGAYSTDLMLPVLAPQLVFFNAQAYVACSDLSVAYTTDNYFTASGDQAYPYLTFSQTSGNMPTVPKFFTAFHVQLKKGLDAPCSLLLSGTVDGRTFSVGEDPDASTDGLRVFPLNLIGHTIQPTLSFVTTDNGYTPVVSDTSILFTPMPGNACVYSFYICCWDRVESRTKGQLWDEKAGVVADWLQTLANTVVTVERPNGPSFQGKVEGLQYVEAPPSTEARGPEGIYQLDVRVMT